MMGCSMRQLGGSYWIVAGWLCEKLLLPVSEELAQFGHRVVGDGDIAVVESCEGSEHGCQDRGVEAGVDLRCAFENEVDVVALGEYEDVGEVASFGAVEEG
jgi:hypothetical protein